MTATSTAIIQAKRGIGDVVWHLPFVRAVAATTAERRVTFFAPPSSHARELLTAEPSVAATIYYEHSGSELRRGLNLLKLAALLREKRFAAVWIFDRTLRPALAARLAGIPRRIGIGLGAQRLFITNAGIDPRYAHDFPIDWLVALMATMHVPVPTVEPQLNVPADAVVGIAARFADEPRPWIAIGLGSSHPDKDWTDDYWAEFLGGLRRRTDATLFLVGGNENASRARELIARSARAPSVNACDLDLIEAAALLHQADLFVGPDSGPMNIAAATGTQTFALFGATRVLRNSKFIHPVVPEGGPVPRGMRLISPAQVLAQIEPYLSRRKLPA